MLVRVHNLVERSALVTPHLSCPESVSVLDQTPSAANILLGTPGPRPLFIYRFVTPSSASSGKRHRLRHVYIFPHSFSRITNCLCFRFFACFMDNCYGTFGRKTILFVELRCMKGLPMRLLHHRSSYGILRDSW